MKYRGKLPKHIDGFIRKVTIDWGDPYNMSYGGILSEEINFSYTDIEIDSSTLKDYHERLFHNERYFCVVVQYKSVENVPMNTEYVRLTNLTTANFLVKWWNVVLDKFRVYKKFQLPEVKFKD